MKWFGLLPPLLFLGGCALDTRTMHLGPDSGAGANVGSGAGAGGGPSGLSGSYGPIPPVEIPECDYDQGVAPGCETLVENPGFPSGIDGWSPEDGTLPIWDATHASIRVWNRLHGIVGGFAPGAARQCIPAIGGAIYDVAADVFIDEGQGLGGERGDRIDEGVVYEGQAGVTVYFHTLADCGGPTERSFDSTLTKAIGGWVHLEGSGRSPELTQSMIVRLNTLKPMREFEFSAKFDNVFVRER
ncbi:MAG TPA: hypothetical protein VJN18_24955 [Polyangiaceae bacterium]|nr:hypothetical protein [Polyangiaceae bacterium]